MPPVAITNARVGRATALLAGRQGAKGTQVSDFTAATATRLWTGAAGVYTQRPYMDETYMTESEVDEAAAKTRLPEMPEGTFWCWATPDSVDFCLQSNYGAPAAGTYALSKTVPVWTTLGWVESTATGATERFVRVRDAWMHRLTLSSSGSDPVRLEAAYAGEATAVQALNGGGITLPASPMQPSDLNVFPWRSVTLTRDPASANVPLRIESVSLTLSQGLAHGWDMLRQLYTVFKTGKLRASLSFVIAVSDEAWAIEDAARAGTLETYRLVMTAPSPSKTLTVDLDNLAFTSEHFGHDGKQYARMTSGEARAYKSGGTFVTVTMP